MVVFYFFAPRMLRSVPYGVEVSRAEGPAPSLRSSCDPWHCKFCAGRLDTQESQSFQESVRPQPATPNPPSALDTCLQSRNVMDIYVPRKKWRRKGPRPVGIFITGGAWIIGYKGERPLMAVWLGCKEIFKRNATHVHCTNSNTPPPTLITTTIS